jgi:teichuronic acid biosynthesis glycosyltransferase TuaG
VSLVSIITPSYNSSQFISFAIQSVLAQTFSDWEMIIVDDCSTDHSVDIIQKFVETDSRIRLIKLVVNSGASIARNSALEAAKGRYIAFLDSDDIWLPGKLQRQLRFMIANDCVFLYSAYERIDEKGRAIGRVGVPEMVSYSDLLKTCSIGCLTAIYDTQYFGKVFMPEVRMRNDLGLWLRLLRKVDYACGLNEVLAQYRVRGDSISANKRVAAMHTWRLYRDIEKLPFWKASYYFAHYAVRGVLRTKAPSVARKIGVLK